MKKKRKNYKMNLINTNGEISDKTNIKLKPNNENIMIKVQNIQNNDNNSLNKNINKYNVYEIINLT